MPTYAATINGKPLTQQGYRNGDFLRGLLAPQKGVVRPGAPGAPAPGSPGAPGAGGLAPAAPPAPDPKDSEYNNGITTIRNSRSGAYADITRAGVNAKQDHDDQTGQLVKARAAALINEKNAAAQRGLFYSSFLTNRDRDVNTGYDDQQTVIDNTLTRGDADRAAQSKALTDQYGADGSDSYGTAGSQLLSEAIARSIANQAAAAPPPAPAAAAAAAPAFTTKATKDSQGRPGVLHIYPDGHTVFVRS